MERAAPTPSFRDRLERSWERSGSLLCVGLDPDLSQVRACVPDSDRPILEFCRAIVDATADLVCAFKPQIAHFAAARAETDLEALIAHVHEAHPGIPVILDAKRGDIGASAEQYAREAFDRYGADALTVNPYLGWESIEPFRRPGRGVVLLCRTSNPGSDWLQEHPAGDPVYLRIAREARERDAGDLMLVVGATWPDELATVRRAAGDLPLLVPGVGAQGGDPAAVREHGADSRGRGLVVNASRSVIFASVGPDFRDVARESARSLHEQLGLLD